MGTQGNFLYRPSYGAQGLTQYTLFDTGLVNADTELKNCYDFRIAATLTGTSFSGTNVYAATITATTFSGANVKATTITATTLSGTTSSGTNCYITTLSATTVSATNVKATTITGTTLSGTTLSATNVYATTITATTFSGTNVKATTVTGTTLSSTTLSATNCYATTVTGTNLSATTFSGTDVKATTLTGTTFSGTNVYATTLTGTTFSGTTFSGTNVYATTLTGTTFNGTNIYATTLTGTTFSGSNVKATEVTATTLCATNYYGAIANITGTNASGFAINMDYISGDEDATLDFNNGMATLGLEYLNSDGYRSFTINEKVNVKLAAGAPASGAQGLLRVQKNFNAVPGAQAVVQAVLSDIYVQWEDAALTSEVAAGSFFVTMNASTPPTTLANVWGMETHLLKITGQPDSQMVGLEVGMHKVPALGAANNIGIYIGSYDLSPASPATRAGDALYIGGARGWTYPIKVVDTDGSSLLFRIDQYGNVVASGSISATNCYATTVTGTTLSGTNILATTVTGTTLSGTTLSGTNVYATTLTGTTFSGTNIKATTVTGTTLSGTTLSGTNVYATTLTGTTVYDTTRIQQFDASNVYRKCEEYLTYITGIASATLYLNILFTTANYYGAFIEVEIGGVNQNAGEGVIRDTYFATINNATVTITQVSTNSAGASPPVLTTNVSGLNAQFLVNKSVAGTSFQGVMRTKVTILNAANITTTITYS